MNNRKNSYLSYIITAGAIYLDIDAYACSIALAELLQLQGQQAIAYSTASYNYSICPSLLKSDQILQQLPAEYQTSETKYIIVDVSDPNYIKNSVPLDQVIQVYDHHTGFEEYWHNRIGDNAHIEFIGAVATLIYREWKKADLQRLMSADTAKLLAAAILDNTLNLTSANTTVEDISTYAELCVLGKMDESWRGDYFSKVQQNIEADLQNALLNDLKTIPNNPILPEYMAQLTVWDSTRILDKLPQIRQWMNERCDQWMLNLIDLHQHISYFICDSVVHQQKMTNAWGLQFQDGISRLPSARLRKEIIKWTQSNS